MRGISIVYEMHKKFGEIWILPPGDDCLDFAGSEVGEALDALMRLNKSYFRNNERSPDVVEEICDVIMMLVKYYMNTYSEKELVDEYFEVNMDLMPSTPTMRSRLYLASAIISSHVLGAEITFKIPDSNVRATFCLLPIHAMAVLLDEVGYDMFASYMQRKMEKYERKIAALPK